MMRQLSGGGQGSPSCAVEDLYDGDWEGMVACLAARFRLTMPAPFLNARVRVRFGVHVAPDVGAD
jgi:hypothetical protein